MNSQPVSFPPRVRKWSVVAISVYLGYLILLGPFHNLHCRGVFDFTPEWVRVAFYLPAEPVYQVHFLRAVYDDWLEWWHFGPDDPDPPTGWK